MIKRISGMSVTVLGLALLIYTATRSLDFIAMTLPADKQILAWFGLAALDGGLVFWLLNFMHGSRGWQRPVALVMVIVDFLGCVAMFTMDTLFNTGKAGMTTALQPAEIQTAVLGLSLIIALNVGSVVVHHLADPENLRQMAEEEARDKIEALAIKAIQSQAEALAAPVATAMGKSWRDQEITKYKALIRGRNSARLPEKSNVFDAEIPEISIELPEKASLELPENPTRPARSRARK